MTVKNLGNGVVWNCAQCGGTSVGASLLQNHANDDFLPKLWNQFRTEGWTGDRRCPSCPKAMKALQAELAGASMQLDACLTCMLLWFDQGELERIKLKAKEKWPQDKMDYKAYRSVLGQQVPYQQRCVHLIMSVLSYY